MQEIWFKGRYLYFIVHVIYFIHSFNVNKWQLFLILCIIKSIIIIIIIIIIIVIVIIIIIINIHFLWFLQSLLPCMHDIQQDSSFCI